MPREPFPSPTFAAVAALLAAANLSACKSLKDGAELRDVKRLDFDTAQQNIRVGSGWVNGASIVSQSVCVEGDPTRTDGALVFTVGSPRTTGPAGSFPLPGVVAPPADEGPASQISGGQSSSSSGTGSSSSQSKSRTKTQSGGTTVVDTNTAPVLGSTLGAPPPTGGTNLRLTDDAGPPGPRDGDRILAEFPTEEVLAAADGYFRNNYDTYMQSWTAINGADASGPRAQGPDGPSGLALADEPAGNVATKLAELKALADQVPCTEPSVLSWIEDMKNSPDLTTTVAVDARTAAVTNADASNEVLGISGDISLKIIGGIGASLSGSSSSIINIDSNSATLLIDVLAAVEVDTIRSAPPVGFNTRGARLNGFGNGLARPDKVNEFKAQCGDEWVFAVAHGSRYSTKLSVARSSLEKKTKLEASGSLDGISLGPIALDVSGTIKSSEFAKEISIAETSELFEQSSGSRPDPMPSSPACRLAYAAALPRATRPGGPVVAFATARYPAGTGELGALNGSKVPAAQSYVRLIERMGKFAHQVFELRTMPYKYEFTTLAALTDKRAKADTAYRQLMGEPLEVAMNPVQRWRESPTDIGGTFGTAVKNAKDGVKRVERASSADERLIATQRMQNDFNKDLKTFEDLETAFGPLARQSGQSYLPLFDRTPNAPERRALRLGARKAAEACDELNRKTEMLNLNKIISVGNENWIWRLPAIAEVKRMRWGANGLLNNDLSRGTVFINAFKPGSRTSAPAFVQVDVGGTANDPVVRPTPAATEVEATICVFAVQTPPTN